MRAIPGDQRAEHHHRLLLPARRSTAPAPGYYYVNLYKPEARPKWEMEALTLHEAVPGHHLQIALARAAGELPTFRRDAGYTAYVEGWALYAESLGEEMGLYQDPYSKFGQLTYEMWRAVRLVVDTGLHAKGWAREQAIDYFKANAAKIRDTTSSTRSTATSPGPARRWPTRSAQLKIRELRAEAEQALGARFDLRAFHDVLLDTGAVPLDIVEATMRRWVATQQAGASLRP